MTLAVGGLCCEPLWVLTLDMQLAVRGMQTTSEAPVVTLQAGMDTVAAIDKFFRNTWNAQRPPAQPGAAAVPAGSVPRGGSPSLGRPPSQMLLQVRSQNCPW